MKYTNCAFRKDTILRNFAIINVHVLLFTVVLLVFNIDISAQNNILNIQEGNSIELVDLSPASPNSLFLNDKVVVEFNYNSAIENILIYAEPVKDGKIAKGYNPFGSVLYAEKSGSGSCLLSLSEEGEIDSIRVYFTKNDRSQTVFFETYIKVSYTYQQANSDLKSAKSQINSKYIPRISDSLLVKSVIDSTGQEIDVIKINGAPPEGITMPVVRVTSMATGQIANVPAFSWSFGCSPTAAAMIAGYYDNNGYPDMYTGPTNGGVMPMTNADWGYEVINGEYRNMCPLSATKEGLDGRTIRGHVDDYWIEYLNGEDDPYITNGWTEHEHGDCTADYMKTNQSAYDNSDGSTTFYFYLDGTPTVIDYDEDGAYGFKLFCESRGYTVTQRFNQYIDGYNGISGGFGFDDFKQQIDAGYLVFIHVVGHTMVGYGYDDTDNTIYIHNTWDYNDHTMTWGGGYEGMQHYAVTVLNLEEAPQPTVYTLTDDDVEVVNGVITSCTYDLSITDIIIPDTLDGQAVTGLGYQLFRFDNVMTSVQLPSTLESIGESAFEHNNLQSVDFSRCKNLASIGPLAFMSNNLTSLNLADTVLVNGGAFNGNSIATLNGEAFDGFFFMRYQDGSKDTTVLMSYAGGETSLIIPSSVQYLWDHALNTCGLTQVSFSQGAELISIGYRAFFGNQISSIDLSPCTALSELKNSALLYSGLSSIDLSPCISLQTIGVNALNSNNFSSFTLPTPVISGMEFSYWEDGNLNQFAGGESVSDLATFYTANFQEDTLQTFEVNIIANDALCNGMQASVLVLVSGGLGGTYGLGGQIEEALTDNNNYEVMVYDLDSQVYVHDVILPDSVDSLWLQIPAGNYLVTVGDADGHELQEMITVSAPDPLEIIMNLYSILCPGDQSMVLGLIGLGGIGPYQYRIYRNGILYFDWTVNSNFTVETNGDYEFNIMDANGCIATESLQLVTPDSIVFEVNEKGCYGDQTASAKVLVENPEAGRLYKMTYTLYEDDSAVSTFESDYFESEVTITGLQFNDDVLIDRYYSFQIVTDLGCVSQDISMDFNPVEAPLTVDVEELNVNEVSADIHISATGGVEPYTVILDDSEIQNMYQTVAPGWHSVVVTDAYNCLVSDSVLIEQDLDCPQYFHPVWEGMGVFDPMNIYIINARIDGEDLLAGDQIGVFDGDVCVGYGKVVETVTYQNVLSVVAGADDGTGIGFTVGDEISYKIWRCNDETEFDVSEAYCFDNQLNPVSCSGFQSGASSFVDLFVSTKRNFVAGFQSGWNIFSLPVLPDSADFEYNFYDLIQSNSLVKIQDETGASVEDWGVLGGWHNNIGDIQLTEGYKVKVAENDSLRFSGTPVKYPFGVPLNPGWNIVGFPSFSIVDGLEVIQQLIDRGTLMKVQDEKGRAIEDLGFYGGWQNFIGNFLPGEGFKVKVSDYDTLWIYESYLKSLVATKPVPELRHFSRTFKGNGTDHMNFNLVGLPGDLLNAGDEMAVYDGTTVVGAVTITEDDLLNRVLSIPVSASDDAGMPGFNEGNVYYLRLWMTNRNQEVEIETEHISGPDRFTRNESVMLSLEKLSLTEIADFNNAGFDINCYPNPFSETIAIVLNLDTESNIEISVMNQLGQLVRRLENETHVSAGTHSFCWDGRSGDSESVSPGMYYLRIAIDDSIISKKIVYNEK